MREGVVKSCNPADTHTQLQVTRIEVFYDRQLDTILAKGTIQAGDVK